MIPEFDDDGYLPPGIHLATVEEIDTRFGEASELRRVQMESLVWMIGLAQRAGAKRIIINGSFVTDKMEPNDVDCVLLIGEGFPHDESAEAELVGGIPFINLELVDEEAFKNVHRDNFRNRSESDSEGNDRGVAMTIENQRQLENTKSKLRKLEELYASKEQQPSDDHVRALTRRSLRKRINQFKEEIARFEARATTARSISQS